MKNEAISAIRLGCYLAVEGVKGRAVHIFPSRAAAERAKQKILKGMVRRFQLTFEELEREDKAMTIGEVTTSYEKEPKK